MKFYVHLEGTVAGGSCSQLGRVTVPVEAADTRDALQAVGAAIGSIVEGVPAKCMKQVTSRSSCASFVGHVGPCHDEYGRVYENHRDSAEVVHDGGPRAVAPPAPPAPDPSHTTPLAQKLQADVDRLTRERQADYDRYAKERLEQMKAITALQRRLNFVGTKPCPNSKACSLEDGHNGPCFITRQARKEILVARLERDEAQKNLVIARVETQGLKDDIVKMANRASHLEARIHALGGVRDPLIPGSEKSVSQAQNEAANAELERLRVVTKGQTDTIASLTRDVVDRSHRISLLEHAAKQSDGRIRVADIQSRKQGDALAAAEKKAARLEAINLNTEYHKARATDLQKRLDECERQCGMLGTDKEYFHSTLLAEREQARQYKVGIEAARDGLLGQQAYEIQVALDTEREVIARMADTPDIGRNQYDLCAWIRARIKDPSTIKLP